MLQQLRAVLGPQRPVHATSDAALLTIGARTFRVQPLPAAPAPADDKPVGCPRLWVAEYIPRQVGAHLRQQGQYYADAMGNAWLEAGPQGLLLLVSGARSRRLPLATGAAFQPLGLRLLLHLLLDPGLAQCPEAELARRTRVPRAAVAAALADLAREGFLTPEAPRQLRSLPALVARWAAGYGAVLRPRLPTQRYRWQPSWHERPAWVALARHTQSLLGGEVAARRLLGCDLPPATYTLYTHTRATAARLHRAGLEPHPEGPVELVQLFAVPAFFPADYCIHPLLIYADLVRRDDAASQCVAAQVLARYLPHLALPAPGA